MPVSGTQVYPGSAHRSYGDALLLQSHYSKAKPTVYGIQSESRVSIFRCYRASREFSVRLYIGNQARAYMKEYIKTKESVPILGRQVIQLLLQAGLRTGP